MLGEMPSNFTASPASFKRRWLARVCWFCATDARIVGLVAARLRCFAGKWESRPRLPFASEDFHGKREFVERTSVILGARHDANMVDIAVCTLVRRGHRPCKSCRRAGGGGGGGGSVASQRIVEINRIVITSPRRGNEIRGVGHVV